jgi:hypothetical protein
MENLKAFSFLPPSLPPFLLPSSFPPAFLLSSLLPSSFLLPSSLSSFLSFFLPSFLPSFFTSLQKQKKVPTPQKYFLGTSQFQAQSLVWPTRRGFHLYSQTREFRTKGVMSLV